MTARRTGRRRVAVRLPASASPGTLLRADHASITGTGPFLNHQSRTRDALRGETVARGLVVDATPEPVLPNATLATTLRVTNPTPSFVFGAVLQLRYPAPLFNLDDSLVSDGGFCPGTFREANELVTWNLGDLAPGAVVDVDLPPVVRNTAAWSATVP